MKNNYFAKENINELALFAGTGGGILGSKLLGWNTVCAVEIDKYAASVLLQRQNDGILEPFPIWDDVRTFDGKPWREIVDVVSGGFPCQDISCAGKGAGIEGAKSGLWGEMRRIICEIRPELAYMENSPMLTVWGLDRLLGDLAEMGYDAEWGIVSAGEVGAPHERERIWILAYTSSERFKKRGLLRPHNNKKWFIKSGKNLEHSNSERFQKLDLPQKSTRPGFFNWADNAWWRTDPADEIESGMGRMVDGAPYRVDRLRAIGNAQVPAVVATAWQDLIKRRY